MQNDLGMFGKWWKQIEAFLKSYWHRLSRVNMCDHVRVGGVNVFSFQCYSWGWPDHPAQVLRGPAAEQLARLAVRRGLTRLDRSSVNILKGNFQTGLDWGSANRIIDDKKVVFIQQKHNWNRCWKFLIHGLSAFLAAEARPRLSLICRVSRVNGRHGRLEKGTPDLAWCVGT